MKYYPAMYTDETDEATDLPFSWRFLFCIDSLLNCIPDDEQYSIINGVYQDESVPLKSLTLFLWELEQSFGRFTDKDATEERQRITSDQLHHIESVFIDRCKKYAGANMDNYEIDMDFLHLIRKIDSVVFRETVASYLKNDVSLINLVSYGFTRGHRISESYSKVFYYHKDVYDDLVDFDDCYARLLTFTGTDSFIKMPEEKQQIVVAFLISCEQKVQLPGSAYITEEQIQKRLQEIVGA